MRNRVELDAILLNNITTTHTEDPKSTTDFNKNKEIISN